MEELRANPAAQELLMQALLTREFLGMPLRLERIESQLDAMLERIDRLDDTVGALVGDTLELKLPGRIVPLLSQKIRLRRAEIMRSPILGVNREFSDTVADAVDSGVLEEWQEDRIGLTDIIIRAQRQSDKAWVWLAIEASSVIRPRDIERARQAADSLTSAFRQDAIAVVAGYRIGTDEIRQADEAGVEALIIE